MPDVLIEEKNHYGVDCSAALWASGEMHDLYHSCGVPHILCDADFVIETEGYILLVEYKNANVKEAIAHVDRTAAYNPLEEKKFEKLVNKFFDSLPYLILCKKTKPIRYVFVVEYPKGDSVSRGLLRRRLRDKLPYKLQLDGNKFIESVDVLNISEWNNHVDFCNFPIKPVEELGT